MTDEERSAYLVESLSLNQVNYENDKLEAISCEQDSRR